jgi:hypothetical protein
MSELFCSAYSVPARELICGSRATAGVRYPASVQRLGTTAISRDLLAAGRIDMILLSRESTPFGIVPRAASATRALLRLSPCY